MDKIIIKGRPAFKGKAEGEALVCPNSIQGWAGVSDTTGEIIEKGHVEEGKNIKDRILVLPGSKGSNGWSGHFHSASVSGFTPAGWIFSQIDSRSGVAAAVLEIPTIVDFSNDINIFEIIESGDWIEMDGDTGEVIITKKI
ncbi:MAG: DUF126 domain-containing protein [Tissierellia bacterium]|nr:DUF126 domain-containing protein [Tissierellia bacterium]